MNSNMDVTKLAKWILPIKVLIPIVIVLSGLFSFFHP